MSPELETLDQLAGGPLPLAVICGLYPSVDAFRAGIGALLRDGDVSLLDKNSKQMPDWAWRELLEPDEWPDLRLRLTEKGAAKI